MLGVTKPVDRDEIRAASGRIADLIRRTPCVDLGFAASNEFRLFVKLETLQPTGAFKVRGASNAILNVDTSSGVVAASGGNFGMAVAYAAHALDVSATVFVPETSPSEKVGQIERFGANLKIVDGYYPEALAASVEHARETGGALLHAYDSPHVVAGQGTIGLEIQEDVPDAGLVVCAVGGGGLIGGIAAWFRSSVPTVGVESELCPTLHSARSAGHPVDVEVGGIAASALGAGRVGEHPWASNQWITDSLLVTDEMLLSARDWLWGEARIMAEPAAVAPIAALRAGLLDQAAGSVVAVVSGANGGRGC